MPLDLGTAYASIEVRLNKLEAGLSDAEKKFATSGKRMEDQAKRTKAALTQSFGELGRSLTIGLTAPLVALGTAAVKAAVDMDSLKRGMNAVTGSSKETEKQLIRLKEIAKLPGLGFKEAIQGSINLQSAGFSARQAEKSLLGFGNALATVGKGKAELDLVNIALVQLANRTSGFGQELRQLQNHLPQIRQALIAVFKTADTEVIQNAGLSGKQVADMLADYFLTLKRVTGGARNDMENFADTSFQALSKIGESINKIVLPALNALGKHIEDVANWFDKLPDASKTALGGLALTGAIIGPALLGISALIKAIGNIKEAWIAMAATIEGSAAFAIFRKWALNPVTLGAGMLLAPQRAGGGDVIPSQNDAQGRLSTLRYGLEQAQRRQTEFMRPADRDRLNRQVEYIKSEILKAQKQIDAATGGASAGGAGGKMDAVAMAAEQKRKKEAEKRAKEIAEERVEVLKQLAVDRAALEDKYKGERLKAFQELQERQAKFGPGEAASGPFKVRMEQIRRDEAEEKRHLRERAQRYVEEFNQIEKRVSEENERAKDEAAKIAEKKQKERLDRLHEQALDALNLSDFVKANNERLRMLGLPELQDVIVDRIDSGGPGSPVGIGNRRPNVPFDNPLARPKSSDELARELERRKDQIKRSLGGHLGTEVAYGFVDSFANGLEKAFGRTSIGKIFARALSRWLDKEVSNLLDNLFSQIAKGAKGGGKGGGGKGQMGSSIGALIGGSAGGPAGGIIGGVLGGMLGFAEGGWVPGPIGAPKPAIVHGGEFVVSRKMQEQGMGGGVTVNLGGVTVAGDYDVDRMMDRISWHAKRRLAVNVGTV